MGGRVEHWRGWDRVRWYVLSAAGLLALLLGWWGFSELDRAGGDSRTPLTHLYESIGLFGLQTGAVDGDVPWSLEVARFLAPLVLATAAIGAFVAVFRRETHSLRARRARDHLVVVGVGPRAVTLARDATGEGGRTGRRRPVLVDVCGDEAGAAQARAEGLTVVERGPTGDSRQVAAALLVAGIGRADALISLTGSLTTDAQVAAAVTQLHTERRLARGLDSFVEVSDVEVARRLAADSGDAHRRAGQEFFNVAERGARALDASLPSAAAGVRPHLVVAGGGEVADSLAVQRARRWSATDDPGAPLPLLTVVTGPDDDLGVVAQRLHRWYPRLPTPGAAPGAHDVCELRVVVPGPEGVPDGLDLVDPLPGAVVVLADDDARGARLALAYLAALPDEVPVTLCSGGEGSVGDLIDPRTGGRLRPMALDDLVLRESAIRAGALEAMAEETYARYREGSGDPGPTWAELTEAEREDNRRPVREVWAGLAAHGYRVVAHTDPDAGDDRMADDPRRSDRGESVRDQLARAEHERWCRQRLAQGFVHGLEAGPTTKPCLLEWDDPTLPEWCSRSTYQQVDGLPRALAAAGLQLRPRPHQQVAGGGGPAGDGLTPQ